MIILFLYLFTFIRFLIIISPNVLEIIFKLSNFWIVQASSLELCYECVYRIQNRLKFNDLACNQFTDQLFLKLFGSYLTNPMDLIRFDIIIQLLTTVLLYFTYRDRKIYLYYAINPWILFNCFSPMKSVFYLHFSILILALKHNYQIISSILFGYFIYNDIQYVILLPFILYFHYNSNIGLQSKFLKTMKLSIILIAIVFVCIKYYKDFASSIYSQYIESENITISPNIGIFWYLDLQIFQEFSKYMTLLTAIQPWLFAAPLYINFVSYDPILSVSLIK